MSESYQGFVERIDIILGQLACEAMVLPAAEIAPRLAAGLDNLAAQFEQASWAGLSEVASAFRLAAQSTTPDRIPDVLSGVDSVWRVWRTGEAQSTGPDAEVSVSASESDCSSEELAVLASDPEIAGMFITEALDHLGSIEATVLQLEASPGDVKLLNDMFRPFHTIKGNAGALGLQTIQDFAHKVEGLLDLGRTGKHPVGPEEIDVILKSVDLLTTMINDLPRRLNGQPATDVAAPKAVLVVMISRLVEGGSNSTSAPAVTARADEQRRAPVSTAGAESSPVAPSVAETAVAVAGAKTTAAEPAPVPTATGRRTDESPAQMSVKVDTQKLDNLVDMVGELVIVQSIIREDPALQQVAGERLARNLAQLRRITSDLQRNAMSLRMVPIRQTFQKMARLVRDLNKASGKTVELSLCGEDTELDRKVVEDINDPLIHMVRNSMDHGIEDPERRKAAGKPPHGSLSLSACHQGGNIVIAIADDGAGLNTDKICAKAVAQGLVQPGETMSPAEIHQLIFRPGFSTADRVTEISGRGVGMDVVRRNIDALRGRVDIHSVVGQGTTFLIKLPLTLAILDGLLLVVGRERFVLPTFAVRESLRPTPENVHAVQGRLAMIKVRDTLLPLFYLSELFQIPDAAVNPWEATVVVIEDDGHRVGLVVDQLIGKQEVVIKSLGDAFSNIRGVAGGAILGDGRIGLILDAGGIISSMRDGAARAA